MKLLILLVSFFLIHSCGQTPKETYEILKSKELNGLVIGTKRNKSGYSLLITQNQDTIYVRSTFVINAHNQISVGDSIRKKKGEMTYTILRKDSVFVLDASEAYFEK